MTTYPRLFIGPMSKQILDVALNYKNILGVIPSRRQIEHNGGYVNNWSTREFSNYIANKHNNILVCRDHGGPLQGSNKDDGKESFAEDIRSGFDILHIDPWKDSKSVKQAVDKTVKLINFCISVDKNIFFEVGTEEAIFSYTADELNIFLKELKEQLGDNFKKVRYAVIQSGVGIRGTQNIGKFNKAKLKRMISVVKNYNLLSKEHNGDYLRIDQISERANAGLDAINIAPELGVIQTRLMIELGLVSVDDAYKVCLSSEKYKKWLPEEGKNSSKLDIVEVSGHYCFTQSPFCVNVDLYYDNLSHILTSRFDEIISAWS